jgi:hypothetical protein
MGLVSSRALVPLGTIRLAKAPAVAFNAARLAKLGAGGLLLTVGFVLLRRDDCI